MNFDISERLCQILDEDELIENLISQNNLYLIDLTDMTSIIILTLWAAVASKKSISLWHRRLDHLRLNFLQKLQNLAVSMKFDKKFKKTKDNHILSARKTWISLARISLSRSLICQSCVRSKQAKRLLVAVRKRNLYKYFRKFFDLIYSNLYEMFEDYDSSKYFMIFINDFICTIFVKHLWIKNQVFQEFNNFCVFIWIQFDVIIQKIRLDNENKYVSKKFQDEMIKKKWNKNLSLSTIYMRIMLWNI